MRESKSVIRACMLEYLGTYNFSFINSSSSVSELYMTAAQFRVEDLDDHNSILLPEISSRYNMWAVVAGA